MEIQSYCQRLIGLYLDKRNSDSETENYNVSKNASPLGNGNAFLRICFKYTGVIQSNKKKSKSKFL